MISIEEAKRIAKKTLSEKRYNHTLNVKKLAVKLAKIYGVDEDKAAMAALLHDIVKEKPKDKLLQICSKNDIILDSIVKRPYKIWHSVVAAVYVKENFGVEDEEILNAIACHTTGRKNMSDLDKIIYLADMASDDRTYPEAEILRNMMEKDLNKATARALGMSISFLKREGKAVDGETIEAYAEIRKKCYGGSGN